jgi:putative transposase
MARLARVIAKNLPHHITQRGNRRQNTFFCDDDYRFYIQLMAEWCKKSKVEIWAYCLMPNHVHMIAVPRDEKDLSRAIGEAHRRYTSHINFREGWRGHLWQGRFLSFLLDEQYLLAAARYIELNPVKAGLCSKPEEYPWSSAKAHIEKRDNEIVKVEPLLKMVGGWRKFLKSKFTEEEYDLLQKHERTGRPLGSKGFIEHLERKLTRKLAPQKGGGRKRHE